MSIVIACNKIIKCMQFVTSCVFSQNYNSEPPYSCQNNINVPPECTKYNHISKIILHAPRPKLWGAMTYIGGQGVVTPIVAAVNRVTNIYIYIYTPVRRCPLLQNKMPHPNTNVTFLV